MAGIRVSRVEDLLLRVLSDTLRDRVRDPRVSKVTIMAVHLSPDLRHAKVFVSLLGDERDRRGAMAGLAASTGFIRREVAHEVRMKTVPEFNFVYDESPDRGERILNLINQLDTPKPDDSPLA